MKKIIRHPGEITTILLILLIPSCDGDVGVDLNTPGKSWVATDPVQCLTNPWEQEWLSRPGNGYDAYPRELDSQYAIIREYYDSLGVEISDITMVNRGGTLCAACSCPSGVVLYLHVRDEDVPAMIHLGYRREFPIHPPVEDATLMGIYQYTGYDSSAEVLITGVLRFTRVENTSVWGVWRLGGPDGYGPQIGTGEFEGWIDGTTVSLNLNPGWADNNVFLSGELDRGMYQGRWEHVTFIGPTYTGVFTAIKK